jgi:hypothetical protein
VNRQRGPAHWYHKQRYQPDRLGQADRLICWNEAECACSTRWPAGVVRMIDAIHDRHLREIEWAYPVEARYVYGIQALVRSSLMMGVYSTARTEEVLR